MIFVDRNMVPLPEVLYSKELEIAQRRLEEFYLRSKDNRSQEKYSKPFEPKLRSEFLRSLREVFNGKCAYCESRIPLEITKSEYDHFRPKSGARGFEKEFSTDHYWWLTYEWNNLYYCCPNCNQYKSTWFPVESGRAPISTSYGETLVLEKGLLIDPCIDNPEDHFSYTEDGIIEGLTNRGKITIEIIKLNRSDLVQARNAVAVELKREFDQFSSLLREEEKNKILISDILKKWDIDVFARGSDRSYLGLRRQLLLSWLLKSRSMNWISENIDNAIVVTKDFRAIKLEEEKTEVATRPIREIEGEINSLSENNLEISELDKIRHVYVEKIELTNFKCFSYLSLDIGHNVEIAGSRVRNSTLRTEPWMLFLGENGVGKSSILKALAIGLSGKEYLTELGATGKEILKHGSTEGLIRIHLVGSENPIEVHFNETEIISTISQPIVNILAYNSIRLKPEIGKMVPEKSEFYGAKVRNLFDYTSSLIDADNWLATLDKSVFDRAALTLKDLMLLEQDDVIGIEGGQAILKRGKEKFYIDELSDGYKTVFYLAVDMMATLAAENVTFDLAEGMVLIDEIGTHLHPRWRMEVVGRLRKAFPKIRFVVTTHEPLCLRGLHAGEAIVLTKNEDKEIIALSDLPDPSELRIDQILTSDFFGLKSTIDPETEALFSRYYSILALDEIDRNDEQKNELLELSQIVPRIKHLGDTEREELTYYVIDELLARKAREDGFKIKDDLKAEALERVASIWKSLDNERGLL